MFLGTIRLSNWNHNIDLKVVIDSSSSADVTISSVKAATNRTD